ncbi:unnamed protein product [Agarophyton chilense]
MSHLRGPNSLEMNDEFVAVDNAIKTLLSKLSDAELEANLVIVSDYGIKEISKDRRVEITHLMEEGTVQDISSSYLQKNSKLSSSDVYSPFETLVYVRDGASRGCSPVAHCLRLPPFITTLVGGAQTLHLYQSACQRNLKTNTKFAVRGK